MGCVLAESNGFMERVYKMWNASATKWGKQREYGIQRAAVVQGRI